jgi:hypothetical protein
MSDVVSCRIHSPGIGVVSMERPPANASPSSSKHSANVGEPRGRLLVDGETDQPDPRPRQHGAEPEASGAGSPGVARPVDLAGVSQQRLYDRQSEYLSVAGLRGDPDPRSQRNALGMSDQQIVSGPIKCSGKGVQIGVHTGLQVRAGIQRRLWTPFAAL